MSLPFLSDLDFSSIARARNLLTPVNDDEAVRKDYVDGIVLGTLYSGAGASGTFTFGSITVNINTPPEMWVVDWIGYNPSNMAQAGIMRMAGFVSRGSGTPIVASSNTVSDTLSGPQTMTMVFTGSNVSTQVNLGTQTNVSWKARVRRYPFSSF